MFVCFTVEDEKELLYYKEYEKINPNPEDFMRCVARERWLEMEFYSEKGLAVFWNRKTFEFTDPKFNPIKISGRILPRCTKLGDYRLMCQSIVDSDAELVTNPYEFNSIENWMCILPNKYLNRKIIVKTKDCASKNFEHFYDSIKDTQGRFFIKSVLKNWSYSGSLEGWYETGSAISLEHGSGDDLVMFSEYMDIKEDEFGTIEYRCFIIDGKLKSMSRYLDYDNPPAPQGAIDFINDFMKKTVGIYFPPTVVLDIAQLHDGDWTFVEANAVPHSGRYCGNSVESFI